MKIAKKSTKTAGADVAGAIEAAFAEQRQIEGNSQRLRAEVTKLLAKGHTTTFAKVLGLLATHAGDRVTKADVAKVLRDFDVS